MLLKAITVFFVHALQYYCDKQAQMHPLSLFWVFGHKTERCKQCLWPGRGAYNGCLQWVPTRGCYKALSSSMSFTFLMLRKTFFPTTFNMCFIDCCVVQVDLGGRKKVTGIATQGKVDLFVKAWTTRLEVWYSLNQYSWDKAFDGQVGQIWFHIEWGHWHG